MTATSVETMHEAGAKFRIDNQPNLIPALTFFHQNRTLFPSDIAGYNALNGPLRGCVVRIGRKKFVDLSKWREFVQRGGQSLPGGWRREAE